MKHNAGFVQTIGVMLQLSIEMFQPLLELAGNRIAVQISVKQNRGSKFLPGFNTIYTEFID